MGLVFRFRTVVESYRLLVAAVIDTAAIRMPRGGINTDRDRTLGDSLNHGVVAVVLHLDVAFNMCSDDIGIVAGQFVVLAVILRVSLAVPILTVWV